MYRRALKARLRRQLADSGYDSDSTGRDSLNELLPLPRIEFTPIDDSSHMIVAGFHSERRHQHPTLAEIEAAHSPDTPLMLLPSAPSIPSRLSQNQIPQTAFMCNAYMNRNIVCPVHRLIHRKNGVAMGKKFVTSGREHIKVELPGIPKRRLASHAKRLQSLRQTHPIIGFEGDTATIGNAQNSSQQNTALEAAIVSDRPESRINDLLSPDNPTPSPSERITKVLSGGKKRLVPSMQLPVTALLQYSPNNQHPPPETHPVRWGFRNNCLDCHSNLPSYLSNQHRISQKMIFERKINQKIQF
eukprot:sb/3467326/